VGSRVFARLNFAFHICAIARLAFNDVGDVQERIGMGLIEFDETEAAIRNPFFNVAAHCSSPYKRNHDTNGDEPTVDAPIDQPKIYARTLAPLLAVAVRKLLAQVLVHAGWLNLIDGQDDRLVDLRTTDLIMRRMHSRDYSSHASPLHCTRQRVALVIRVIEALGIGCLAQRVEAIGLSAASNA
jgi:hypothetical protein